MKPTYEELLQALKEVLDIAKNMSFSEEDATELEPYDDLILRAEQ